MIKHRQTTHFVRGSKSSGSFTYTYPTKEYGTIFKMVLAGTFILIGIISTLLFYSYVILHNTQVFVNIVACVISLLYLGATHILWTKNRSVFASRLLVGFYFFIAVFTILGGGINNTFGELVFTITIFLSGILLGPRAVLYTVSFVVAALFTLQFVLASHSSGLFAPNAPPSVLSDAIAYSVLMAILGLISWLFGTQTERLLIKNNLAEEALTKEKELLEIRVRERTEQLQKAQLDEIEQLHQFAEIGQLSAALLHDLANHLTVLNFDIADLKKTSSSDVIYHVEESIRYLEQAVGQVRKQLQGKNQPRHFDAVACLKSSLQIIEPKATEAHVKLSLLTPEKSAMLYGDPLRLTHVINVIVKNAIESYHTTAPEAERIIIVSVEVTITNILIHVVDHGSGITRSQLERLFKPTHSTKKEGLGIGLFIAKKITETHFKGTLELGDTEGRTEFVINLPRESR